MRVEGQLFIGGAHVANATGDGDIVSSRVRCRLVDGCRGNGVDGNCGGNTGGWMMRWSGRTGRWIIGWVGRLVWISVFVGNGGLIGR